MAIRFQERGPRAIAIHQEPVGGRPVDGNLLVRDRSPRPGLPRRLQAACAGLDVLVVVHDVRLHGDALFAGLGVHSDADHDREVPLHNRQLPSGHHIGRQNELSAGLVVGHRFGRISRRLLYDDRRPSLLCLERPLFSAPHRRPVYDWMAVFGARFPRH